MLYIPKRIKLNREGYTIPPASEQELLERCERVAGYTIAQLSRQLGLTLPPSYKPTSKGFIGTLLEYYLKSDAGNLAEPDFRGLGVELKTLPVTLNGRPTQSTFVTTTPLKPKPGLTWETSAVYKKLKRVLWWPIETNKQIPLAERRLGSAFLWSPTSLQETVLQQDWEELTDLIQSGHLGTINNQMGQYLMIQIRTASRSALTVTTNDIAEPILTASRGFYLRPAFTQQILSQHYEVTA